MVATRAVELRRKLKHDSKIEAAVAVFMSGEPSSPVSAPESKRAAGRPPGGPKPARVVAPSPEGNGKGESAARAKVVELASTPAPEQADRKASTTRTASVTAPKALSAVLRISGRKRTMRSPAEQAEPKEDGRKGARRPTGKRKKRRVPRLREASKGYMRPGKMYSAACIAHERWTKHCARVAGCGSRNSITWMGALNTRTKKHYIRPAACHARDCKGCRPNNIRERVGKLSPASLLTLSFRYRKHRTRVRDYFWLTLWPRFTRFMRLWRWYFGSVRYIAVAEPHKSGMPHVHVALPCCPTYTVMRKNKKTGDWERAARRDILESIGALWRACGGGYAVDYVVLKGDGMYIAKYIDKLGAMPEDIRALLTLNKIGLYHTSKGLTSVKGQSEWTYKRGSKAELEDWEERMKRRYAEVKA